ncbi:cytosol aminopeptidase-like isoform X2 [Cylas formicarius]|uniref:cytosol aminopeptidase-like isoform X2 n=1 Tax=Cylas formicarius TaxID=197179 RepID=UPI002958A1F9|nr:cytosol aminopeptidase-like isoform X2 [Cylas formicarius]
MALVIKSYCIPRLYTLYRTFRKFSSTSSANRKGLVLGVYSAEDGKDIKLSERAEKFNQVSQGKLLESIHLTGGSIKPGKSFIFWGLHQDYPAIAVVGLPCKTEIDECEIIRNDKESVRTAIAAGCKALDLAGIKQIFIDSLGDPESAAESSTLSTWKFQDYKTKKDELATVQPYELQGRDCENWTKGVLLGESQNLARKLADTPANLMTPTIFAQQAEDLLRPLGVDVKVYDGEWAKRQKMFALLAVAKGSVEPPKFLELTYKKSDGDPYVLIGKGVTFDAGGISLKPAQSMDEMRADMSGAACVFATLYGLAKLNVPTSVKVLIPLVENLPSGNALKPGDVIYARNGKSICVDNTDAEGRLILADALCYSLELKPKWVLDIATLTGAMRVALGNAATGVFSNCTSLYQSLEQAGSETGDRVWRLPLWKHYTKQISENAAYDLNNIGNAKGGGSCTAAAFLKEFVPKDAKWLHLDIAGVMGPNDSSPYLSKGMTGRPTRTLINFVERQSK